MVTVIEVVARRCRGRCPPSSTPRTACIPLLMVIVFVVTRSRLREHGLAAAVVGALLVVAACSKNQPPSPAGVLAAGPCPTAPVNVVVSVDQWGDIVSTLGANCARVKTILVSSSVDPHDYEPSPADAADFSGSQLVVVNGADYDPWALKLASTALPNVPVVSAAKLTDTPDGANPHLWYRPSAVTALADAITAELAKLSPSAGAYFAKQRSTLRRDLEPYNDLIAKITREATGKSYAATERIFDYMATALGLVDKTPEGYQQAVANETDPSPGDLEAFRTALAERRVDVLIFNPQTEGAVPDQIRAAAEQARVPVVAITETVAAGAKSFQGWQTNQLSSLAKALDVPA
jgi:zinc/manganese transport system substrate-binding protein